MLELFGNLLGKMLVVVRRCIVNKVPYEYKRPDKAVADLRGYKARLNGSPFGFRSFVFHFETLGRGLLPRAEGTGHAFAVVMKWKLLQVSILYCCLSLKK